MMHGSMNIKFLSNVAVHKLLVVSRIPKSGGLVFVPYLLSLKLLVKLSIRQ